MITTAPTHSSKERAEIMALLVNDLFTNQLIIGDIHAPMDALSDVFKLVKDDKVIGGWTVFKGLDTPTVVFPPTMPETWGTIKEMVETFDYPEIFLTFPKKLENPHDQLPWNNWSFYNWEHMFTDKAMKLDNKKLEIMDISHLPKIRGPGTEDIPKLNAFFDKLKEHKDYTGFWHPQQLKSDLFIVAEDDEDNIIAVAGTHFETPLTVQIGNVHVLPEYRKKGLGKAISTAVIIGIVRFNRIATLFVNEHNVAAQRMYEKIGFEYYNEFMFYQGKKCN